MHIRFIGGLLLCLGVLAFTTGCLFEGGGSDQGTEVVINPSAPDPNSYSCNPLDGEQSIEDLNQGIEAELYYLDSTQPQYDHVSDYFSFGHFVEGVKLYFNQIFVPTRPFDRGFTLANGQTIVNPNDGSTLYEYFAIRHRGRIQLGSKAPGLYDFAILSDDGAILYLDDGSGNLVEYINNDGQHPTKMACSTVPVELGADDKISFQLDYNQGPRYHISLILMWRPHDPTKDKECGKSGNEYFFDYTQDPPTPTSKYNGLLARGWQPLAPENYKLPDDVANNPCNEPAPVISNFRVISIMSTTVTLAWDTDRNATSQVIYRAPPVGGIDEITDGDGQFRMTHTVTVTGLTPNTEYRMRAASASTSGLSTESAELAVRTRR